MPMPRSGRIGLSLASAVQPSERNGKNPDKDWQLSERTAFKALTESAFTDDAIVQEYLAGIVAASRPGHDDVHLVALVARLSPIQLIIHYLLYASTIVMILR